MTPSPTHRATIENGPAIVDGRLVWTSATGITTADPNSFGGCTRKWWYDYVAGEKAPATKAMMGGTALHTEVENHLLLGHSLQSPLALSGFMFIPRPGPGLEIERPIHFTTRTGVDIYGHVDLYNFRQEYIDADGTLQRDQERSFEVKDWKTTSDFQYAKTERELKENIQLITYAEAGFRLRPDAEHSRMTHVYFRTRGAPASKLVTVSRTRAEVAARWHYSEGIVRVMADVVRETSPEAVPGNRRACDAYSGCPHRGKCSVFKFDALNSVYGKIAEDHANTAPGWRVASSQPNQEKTMGLLANNPTNPQPMNQPSQPDMRAQLAAEEQQLRAQQAQQQAQMPQPLNTAALADVCNRLNTYGYGFPALGGNAAQAFAVLNGQQVQQGATYAGIIAPAGSRRSLHGIQLTEVQHIFQLEGELAAERAQNTPSPAPPVPPTVQYATQAAPPPTTNTTVSLPTSTVGFLPPDAPQSIPALAMQHPASVPNVAGTYQIPPNAGAAPDPMQAAPEAAAPAKTRGRPKKPQDAAPGPIATSEQVTTAPTPAPVSQVAPVASSPSTIQGECGGAILVNCRSSSNNTKSLNEYVDYINASLSKRYCVGADGRPTIQDVRCAPKGSGLDFGGWQGAVRETVKIDPPPPGNYHLDTFMDALNEAVADALRMVADQKGWLYIRGVRG